MGCQLTTAWAKQGMGGHWGWGGDMGEPILSTFVDSREQRPSTFVDMRDAAGAGPTTFVDCATVGEGEGLGLGTKTEDSGGPATGSNMGTRRGEEVVDC